MPPRPCLIARHASTPLTVLALAFIFLLQAGCGRIILTHPSALELLNRSGFSWDSDSTEHFDVFYETASMTAERAATFGVESEQAREQVLIFLEEDQYDERVSIFLVESKERMNDLIGLSISATGFNQTNTICLIPGSLPPASIGHELLHVIAMNNWKVPARWINEGLAVAYDGQVLEHELHALAKHLLKQDQLPSLYELTHRFARLPNWRSYPAVGSFVKFLYDQYGLTTVRKIWEGGASALESATGVSLREIEQAWLDVVRQADSGGIVFPAGP